MTTVCAVPVATVWSSPDRVRPVDRPAVQAEPDLDAWVSAMSPEDRVDLQDRTETQLVLDEQVEVVGAAGEWSQVVIPGQSSSKSADGYPGWVPSVHLGEALAAGEPVVVTEARAVTYRSAGDEEGTGWLTLGTTLPQAEVAGDRVRLGAWWVPSAGLGPVGRPQVTNVDVLDVAMLLLGVPYVWGGCSAAGIDCSGLVMTAHRVLGRPVPRDAHDQLAAATAVPLAARQRGDVLFFARAGEPAHHVGFDAGGGLLLHANMGGGRGEVECVPMPPERAGTLVAAARFVPTP